MATTLKKNVARLILLIDRVPYDLRPGDKDTGFWNVKLRKNSTTSYIVSDSNHGRTCTCPDFEKRRRPDGCKHIRALAVWGI